MLIEFSVENYLSFKDRVTLSMVASGDTTLPENVIKNAQGTKFNLLKTAAIYGANASGKSNIVKALSFFRNFVLTSSTQGQIGTPIDVIPFKLDQNYISKPSEFEVIFLVDGVSYQYGFSVDSGQVYEEWLYSFPKSQRRMLFEREQKKGDEKASIKFGSHWKGEKEILMKMTRPNALFLSVATQFNNENVKNVFEWIYYKFYYYSDFDFAISPIYYTTDIVEQLNELKNEILQFLIKADLGITDFEIRKKTGEEINYGGLYEVITFHQGINQAGQEIKVDLSLDDESEGTKKLFGLAGPIKYSLKYRHVFISDELDTHLHPLLTKWLIKLFQNENPNDAQLIFTTHDSNLLDREMFRRDQIWFTEKDKAGATSLYSLWEMKDVRKEENYEKGYLMGRYGAIPFLGDI